MARKPRLAGGTFFATLNDLAIKADIAQRTA
jgi:hypothetical protein